MEVNCEEDGCVFPQTGICKRTGQQKACEMAGASSLSGDLEAEIARQAAGDHGVVHAVEKDEKPAGVDEVLPFHHGNELGLSDIASLMREAPSHVITILGEHKAGKTSFICALYFLASSGELDTLGFGFAGSMTLPGFEERSRRSRVWKQGKIPDEMTVRTEISDERSAGFMHLDLRRGRLGSRWRLLLTDLPGEWTTQLIDNASAGKRLGFISRSDAILILIDGPSLAHRATRSHVAEQNRILIDRIAPLVPAGTPLGIVVAKGDQIRMEEPPALSDLVQYAREVGFQAEGRLAVAFSGTEEHRSGTGIFETIQWAATAGHRMTTVPSTTASEVKPTRMFGWQPIMAGK